MSEDLKFRPVDVEWVTDVANIIPPEQFTVFVRVCADEYAKAVDVLKRSGLA